MAVFGSGQKTGITHIYLLHLSLSQAQCVFCNSQDAGCFDCAQAPAWAQAQGSKLALALRDVLRSEAADIKDKCVTCAVTHVVAACPLMPHLPVQSLSCLVTCASGLVY